MKVKVNELWKYLILIWMVCNVITIFIPQIYLWILPYYTSITAVVFFCILVLKSRHLNKKVINGLLLVYVGLILFILLQGKNPLNYLTILSSPVAFVCLDKITLSRKEKKRLFYFIEFTWLILVLLSFGYFDRFTINRSSMVNSNTMGMYLLDMAMLLLYFFDIYEKKLIKSIVVSFVTILSLYLGYQARGNLIAFLFFLLCCIFRKHIMKNYKRILILAAVLIIAGGLIPFIYIQLIQNNFFGVRTYSLKDMYTREGVWSDLVGTFVVNKSYLITGLPSNELEIMGSAIHNNSFELLASTGILGLVLYFIFVFSYMKTIIADSKHSNKIDLLIFAFLSLLVQGFTEVSLFWSVTYVLHYMYLGLASGNEYVNIPEREYGLKLTS